MVEFDFVVANITFDLLLPDESDLMKSETYKNFSKKNMS